MQATVTHPEASVNGDAAQTVSETVMAEQDAQHVVIDLQSASASAPVDVAANPITTVTADAGKDTVDSTEPKESTNESIASISRSVAVNTNERELVNELDNASRGESVAEVAAVLVTEDGVTSAAEETAPMAISDAEGSKVDAEATEQRKDGNHHVRTNSVKKPATFSKVSATRNFLAKTASPVPVAAAKLGDKPSTLTAPAQPVAKPRLIAKSASALQSVQRPRPGSEGTGAPDASKVWNKNRPVAPAPPKHFTDEELKQQYGIHLATRLQTDEGGEKAKWADIDEDEEDWAPETVVWMDGTKSTLTPAEVTEVEKQMAAPAPAAKPADRPKPILAVRKPTELGPQKTILKPGIAVLQAKQTNGAAGGSSMEKATLKAKSPAPTPAKSPWAPLPPVDLASPINPPVQQAQQSPALPPQDARAYEPQAPAQPAREIPADTFDRSWRDGEGAPRELFNSANGRYEPAPEGRRTSIRPDAGYRKPSLLQRSSQGGHGPAEPSAAFQARNSSQVDGSSWGRRRGSSVSQGSIPSARRMSSVSRHNDLPTPIEQPRRESTIVGHDPRASPVSARGEAAKPSFVQQSPWDQQLPPRPEPGTEAEDPIKAQERVMRAKREEAKKRKLDEEDRLKRETQERLAAKLATMGGAGKSRKEREAEAAAAAIAAKQPPMAEQPKQPEVQSQGVESTAAAVSKPTESSVQAPPTASHQPLPPAPPQSAASDEKLPAPLPPKPTQAANLPERSTSSADDAQRQAPRAHLSPRANARATFSQQPSPYRPPQSTYSSPGDRKQQPFARSPLTNSDTFSGWNTTAPNVNVWGTSGIGNGTFGETGSFAPFPTSQQTSALPPPPGMGPPGTNNRISPQSISQDARSPNVQQQQLSEQQRSFAPPGIDSGPNGAWGASRNNGPSPAPGLGRQTHLPSPIAPPSRAQLQQQPSQRQDAISSWNNAAATLPHQYAADADAAARKQQEAVIAPPRDNVIKETFKRSSAEQGRLGGPRRFEAPEYIVHDAQGSRSLSSVSPAPPSTQTQPTGPVPTASPLDESSTSVSENTVRLPDGSRNPAHGGTSTRQPPIAPPHMRRQPLAAYQGNVNFPTDPLPGVPVSLSKDQSPPPPEATSHPAYSGDGYPHVKLPPPPPRVRLPPVASAQTSPLQSQSQLGVTMPQRHVQQFGPPGAARPLVMNGEWQARFNGLFNRANIQTEVPPSPPRTPPKTSSQMHDPALAVMASSMALMEDVPAGRSATVSLPVSPPRKNITADGFTIDSSGDVISKPTIDQMFEEERSFGSKPIVRFPHNARYHPGIFTDPNHNVLKMSRYPQQLKTIAESKQMFTPEPSQGILVKIFGTKLQDSDKLIKFPASQSKKGKSEKKPSLQISKGKSSAKGSGSNTPTPTGTPTTGSRQASFQKTQAPAPSLAVATTPVAAAAANLSTNAEGGNRWRPQRGGFRGGRGRGALTKASQ
ncbi:hypothetical protein LTR15_009898 [Elasticomyces elasticus]|nr:hypothetical protein LTR15_009898 [Elasticomyces elasticus]